MSSRASVSFHLASQRKSELLAISGSVLTKSLERIYAVFHIISRWCTTDKCLRRAKSACEIVHNVGNMQNSVYDEQQSGAAATLAGLESRADLLRNRGKVNGVENEKNYRKIDCRRLQFSEKSRRNRLSARSGLRESVGVRRPE